MKIDPRSLSASKRKTEKIALIGWPASDLRVWRGKTARRRAEARRKRHADNQVVRSLRRDPVLEEQITFTPPVRVATYL